MHFILTQERQWPCSQAEKKSGSNPNFFEVFWLRFLTRRIFIVHREEDYLDFKSSRIFAFSLLKYYEFAFQVGAFLEEAIKKFVNLSSWTRKFPQSYFSFSSPHHRNSIYFSMSVEYEKFITSIFEDVKSYFNSHSLIFRVLRIYCCWVVVLVVALLVKPKPNQKHESFIENLSSQRIQIYICQQL